MTKDSMLLYIGEWLNNADDDILACVEVERDPGYIYVKDSDGREFIIRIEDAQ